MRATRVIYVENDPALRGIMTSMLSSSPDLEVMWSAGSPSEALALAPTAPADVALLDLALGTNEMNGIDLGLALRQLNPDLGIVIHSQYPLDVTIERVPVDARMGWSTVQKSGQMDLAELVAVLKSTAKGLSRREPDDVSGAHDAAGLRGLSERQRSIMALSAVGYSPQQVADRLGLSYDVVRQDLVRAYKVLVPDDSAGDDRRTLAVLSYSRLARDEEWESP
jgi:DNA-binding NarL/FixJ family response regulator